MKMILSAALTVLFSLQLYSANPQAMPGNEKPFELHRLDTKFNDQLSFEIVTTSEQTITIEVSDQLGQKLYYDTRTVYGELERTLITDDYPKGVYTLKITCQDIEVIRQLTRI